MSMVIYLVTNKLTGKQYIGQTRQDLADRWSMHRSSASRCTALSAGIKEFGSENFTIETVFTAQTEEDLCKAEVDFINKFNTLYPNGYNLNKGGTRPVFSEESKRKMSESAKKRRPISESTRKKLSENARKLNLGKKFTEEHRAKLSLAHMGSPSGMLGKKHKNSSKRKMSKTKKALNRGKSNE